jgi:hypothetical protein
VSFVITRCVASQRVFVVVYFIMDSVRACVGECNNIRRVGHENFCQKKKREGNLCLLFSITSKNALEKWKDIDLDCAAKCRIRTVASPAGNRTARIKAVTSSSTHVLSEFKLSR